MKKFKLSKKMKIVLIIILSILIAAAITLMILINQTNVKIISSHKERFPASKNFKLYKTEGSDIVGVMDNMYVSLELPKATVAKMLPKGLHLAEQKLTDGDKHPVMIFFTHNDWRMFPIPNKLSNYREMLVGIPYVKPDKSVNKYEGSYTYMPRLYIDAYFPRIFGNNMFGLEKLTADFEDDLSGTMNIYTKTDHCLIARADLIAAGNRMHTKDFDNITPHMEMFHLPFISQTSRMTNPDAFPNDTSGGFTVSWIDYNFADPMTRITPLEGQVEIGNLFTPAALPKGVYDIENIQDNVLGAFRLEIKQQMSFPVPLENFNGKNYEQSKELNDAK